MEWVAGSLGRCVAAEALANSKQPFHSQKANNNDNKACIHCV